MKRLFLLAAVLLALAGYVLADSYFDPLTGKVITLPKSPTFESITVTGSATIGGALLETFTATAANNFSAGEVGYLAAAGTITKADASAEATVNGLLVMATATIAGGASGSFAHYGKVTAASHGFTVGAPLYVSETTGSVTTTAPVLAGAFLRVIGYAADANTIYFVPNPVWAEVQ